MLKIMILIIIAIIFLPFILFLFTKDEKEEFQCKLLEEKRREDRWKIWKRNVYRDNDTEERAKEVLQEIVSKYKTTLYNTKTNETVVNIPKVFEMPIK